MECFRLLLDHIAWIEHQFLSGIRDFRRAESLWEMMRGIGRVRRSIDQSWLAKGLGLWLLCWGFQGVQEEIPSEETSTVQIGPVAFPPGQCTSPQLHPRHRLFDQDGHQDSSSIPVIFGYSLSSETVVMKEAVMKVIDTLTQILVPFEVISSGWNALVPFQQLLEGPMEVLLCECQWTL